MGQYPLLATKLYVLPVWGDPSTRLRTGPSRPDVPSGPRARLVSHPRLIERLRAGLYGKLEAASGWVRERGLLAAGELKPWPEFDFFSLDEHVVLARVLIAQAQLDEATGLLPRLLEAAEAGGGRASKAIEIQVLQALALQAGARQPRP